MKKIFTAVLLTAMAVATATFTSCTKDIEEIADDINTGISSGDHGTSRNAVLQITCTSNNPYTIEIVNTSTNDSREYTLQGKETRSFTVTCDVTYKVNYSQNSGYLLYPTTGTRTQYAGCGSTYSISFPN
ncbi:MAG: hypothetical protein J6Z26_00865 [Bacteroidales bacterium]|jgi:hypothetical protein|nr:hypothetical protein [Bacteroidales bacterium]